MTQCGRLLQQRSRHLPLISRLPGRLSGPDERGIMPTMTSSGFRAVDALRDSAAFLKRHLPGASRLSDDDVAAAASVFIPRHVEKGAHLLAPGDLVQCVAVSEKDARQWERRSVAKCIVE